MNCLKGRKKNVITNIFMQPATYFILKGFLLDPIRIGSVFLTIFDSITVFHFCIVYVQSYAIKATVNLNGYEVILLTV